MRSTGESRVAILHSITLLAVKVEHAITETKILKGVDKWILALFKRMILASRAVEILLRNGFTADSKLLSRVNHDAFWDLLFLQHDPSKKRESEQLIYNEALVDDYKQVAFMAMREGQPLRQYVRGWREGEGVVRLYEQIKASSAEFVGENRFG